MKSKALIREFALISASASTKKEQNFIKGEPPNWTSQTFGVDVSTIAPLDPLLTPKGGIFWCKPVLLPLVQGVLCPSQQS